MSKEFLKDVVYMKIFESICFPDEIGDDSKEPFLTNLKIKPPIPTSK